MTSHPPELHGDGGSDGGGAPCLSPAWRRPTAPVPRPPCPVRSLPGLSSAASPSLPVPQTSSPTMSVHQESPTSPLLSTRSRLSSRPLSDSIIQGATRSSRYTQDSHIMERSPVATPHEIEERFCSGSPSARNTVEVIMHRIPPTTKRTRVSTDSARTGRTKRTRLPFRPDSIIQGAAGSAQATHAMERSPMATPP